MTFEAKVKDFKMCPRGLHLWLKTIKVLCRIAGIMQYVWHAGTLFNICLLHTRILPDSKEA